MRMHSVSKNHLANKNGPFFRTIYTSEMLFLGNNSDLPDFVQECKKKRINENHLLVCEERLYQSCLHKILL